MPEALTCVPVADQASAPVYANDPSSEAKQGKIPATPKLVNRMKVSVPDMGEGFRLYHPNWVIV